MSNFLTLAMQRIIIINKAIYADVFMEEWK